MKGAAHHRGRRTATAVILAVALAASARAADIREADAWPSGVPQVPLEERVAPAPPPLVEYLRDDNKANGFREVPRAATPHGALGEDIRDAVATMPSPVKALVADKLIGIFTVRGLGSTAWSEQVEGRDGGRRRGVVALDIDALDKRGNVWLSWREATAFRPEPGFAVRARIAAAGSDGRTNAIRYILLHEFAHIISIGANFLPDWNLKDVPPERTCIYAFACLSWTQVGDGRRSRYDDGFAARPRIAYYQPVDRRLDAGLAVPLYRWLAGTDFVSAYAATSAHEDFAEAFANYVHVRLLGLPYRVDILRDGEPVAAATPCWDAPRCAAKRRFLEDLLGGGG